MLQLSCLPWFYSTCTWGLLLCPLIIMLALFRTIKFQSLVHHVYPTCPKVNLNPSHYSESGTLLQVLPHRHHPSLAPASFMLSAIADSDKPIAGATSSISPPGPAHPSRVRSAVRASFIIPKYVPGGSRVDSRHSYPGNRDTVIYHDVNSREENFGCRK
jgi:hypothetical protein